MKTLFVWLMLLLCSSAFAQVREIAITIDDLPFVGSANGNDKKLKRENERFYNILQALIDHKVPATGFIIAGSIEKGQWQLLEDFKNAGFPLGNHTYSHYSLNSVSAENYINDLDKADKVLSQIMTTPKYFRYPYLAESTGEKKQKVYLYLSQHQYTIVPVTIDSKDFLFNNQLFAIPYRLRPQNLERMKQRYLNYIWKQTLKAEARAAREGRSEKQILLIHANLINSHFLGDIIEMYQKNGYRIISLEEALKTEKGEDTPVAVDLSEKLAFLFIKPLSTLSSTPV